MASQKKSQSVYQIKITLRDIRPLIWRRVQVRSDVTLGHLHWVIQFAMGWTNSHLHLFSIQGEKYSMPMLDFGINLDDLGRRDEQLVKLSDVITGETFKFFYLYDFGDSWEHEILVEKVLTAESDVRYPACIKAKRACPPEDCGGTWGYEEFLEAIQDPEHPEHESLLEWIDSPFNPEDPDLDEINRLLKTIPHDTTGFDSYIF